MSSKSLVEDAIAQNDIVIFSKSWCPYCKKAKTLANTLVTDNKTLKVFELDELDEGADIQAYLLDKTGQRTVPSVFIQQQHIGGNDDFQAAHRSGKVKTLLSAQ